MKKTVLLASIIAAGMGTTSLVNAADATATWVGQVPSNIPDDKIVITGQGGALGELEGLIHAETDGTFTSDPIIVEARTNDSGDPDAPSPGALIPDADWVLQSTTLRYDNKVVLGAKAEVLIDGSKKTIGEGASDKDTIAIQISQEQPLDPAEVDDATIHATVSISATNV